jgi:hypothetical protein
LKTSSPALFDVYNVSPIAGQTGWAGTISLNGGLNSTKMYKSKFALAQNVLVTGLPLDLSTKTFTLDTNWVGLPYIANRNLSLNEALAYLDAQDGDLIKSQSQFAIFDRLSRTRKGNLTTMTVGEGYMVKTSRPQTFRYPSYANNNQTTTTPDLPTFVNGIQTNGFIGVSSSITQEAPQNTVPSSSIPLNDHLLSYGETMNIVAEIPKNFNEVSFYNKETNQLIGQSQMVQIGDKQLVFATIYGDTSNNIVAKLSGKDQVVNATTALTFKSNSVVGSLETPLKLNVPEELALELNTYPNPFINDVTIEFTSDINGTAIFNIYNDQSRIIESKQINVTKGLNKYKYHASKAAMGNYLVFKVEVGNKVYTKVVIKQ